MNPEVKRWIKFANSDLATAMNINGLREIVRRNLKIMMDETRENSRY